MATSTRTPAARSCSTASTVDSRTPSASATSPRSVRSRGGLVQIEPSVAGRPRRPGRRPRAPAAPRRPARSTRSRASAASGAAVEHDLGRALHHQAAVAQAAENPRPAVNGRQRSGLAVARAAGGLDDGPVGLVDVRVGRVAGGRGEQPSRSSVAGRRPSGTSRTTRSRFSVSVPVLSKQTVSTRPSASSTRALRTTAPRRDSRRAAACCATVATSGSPSGTAATATATPALTASRSGRRHSSEQPDDGPAAGQGERQHRAGQLAQPRLHARPAARPRRRRRVARPACGRRADGDDHGPAAPGDDRRALEAACRSGRRAPRRASPAPYLRDRQRLAGEPGLVDLEVAALQQPGVGGDDVAGLDADHVADPQRACRHVLAAAVVGAPADLPVRDDRPARAAATPAPSPRAAAGTR